MLRRRRRCMGGCLGKRINFLVNEKLCCVCVLFGSFFLQEKERKENKTKKKLKKKI